MTTEKVPKRTSLFRYIPFMGVVLVIYNLLSLQYADPNESFENILWVLLACLQGID